MFLIFVFPAIVCAAPTGLVIIPIPDVLPAGAVDIQLSAGTSTVQPEPSLGFEIGVGHGIELGYDGGPSNGVNVGWSIKKVLVTRQGKAALSVGYLNVGPELEAEPFVVGGASLGKGTFYLGFTEILRIGEPFIGYQHPINNKAHVQADYTAGKANSASLGLVASITSNLLFSAAYIRENQGPSRDNGWFELDYVFSIR